MKLFKISQIMNPDYDTFDSAVVCAESEDDAKDIHPNGGQFLPNNVSNYEWVDSKNDVIVEYLGEAGPGLGRGVVCASYNAG